MKGKIWIVLILAAAIASCHKHEAPEPAAEEPEVPVNSVTLWSEQTELFMEYPELVREVDSPFAVHLTDLKTFKPLMEGIAALELVNSGSMVRFESNKPSRPGIFRIDANIEVAGKYQAVLTIRAPNIEDRHEFGEVVVHENMTSALAFTEQEMPTEAISFLKEQQWGTEFATELAVPKQIEEMLQVPAVVQVRGGGEGSAVSPVKGRLAPEHVLPVPGRRIRKGDLITAAIPFTATPQDLAGLKLELSQAETDLAQAQTLRKRLETLLTERAIPARRVEETKVDELRAEARIRAAKERLDQFERSRSGIYSEDTVSGAFEIRAPLSGVVTELSAVTGGSVEAGQEILHITDVDRIWVTAQVPEAEIAVLRNLKRAELLLDSGTISIPGRRGRIERIGRIVDPESRRIPVIFEVLNNDGMLKIGQSLFARLSRGQAEAQVSVPVSALVDDAGRPVVFIQSEGESFKRKPVRTGISDGDYVQILEGVQAGDRIVSRGAYLIRLAALSTQIPAHGHVH